MKRITENMRNTMILFLIMLSPLTMTAQNITGRVQDQNAVAVSYANVSLLKADSTFIAGAVTDDNGSFSLFANAEGKILKVSYIGYQTLAVDVERQDMGVLTLMPDSRTLNEVEVVARKQLIKSESDRISYQVQNDPDSKTKNTLDMLKKTPFVSVDGQENIRVKGSTSFKIYKNGHPDPTLSQNAKDALKAIPASMIKKIEVITEPGAKYDAEGVTAILNIVTVDNVKISGVTGTLSAEAQSIGDVNLNSYLTAQVGKFITSVNYGYYLQSSRRSENIAKTDYLYTQSGNHQMGTSRNAQPAKIHVADINVSYDIDTLNLLTLSGGGYFYTLDVNGYGTTALRDAADNLLYSYRSDFFMPGYSYQNWSGRMDYEHRTRRKDETLTLSYMLAFTRRTNDEQTTYSEMVNMPVAYKGYDQKKREQFAEHTFQIDWTRPLGEHHKVELGAKYIYRLNKSQTSMLYDNAVDNMDSHFNHGTQVAAGYFSYMFSRGKWSARAGIRYEYSYLKAEYPDGSGQGFHKNLSDWVPSANAQYKFNDANSLKFNFSTSINRPGISYLNPAVLKLPTSVSYGNSALSSSRNTTLGLTFMHVGEKLTYNIYFSSTFANNRIGAVKTVRDDVTYNTYDNILHYKGVGIGAYVQWNILENTSFSLDSWTNYRNNKNSNAMLSLCGWSQFMYGEISQKLPWKLLFSASVGCSFGRQISDVYGYRKGWHWYDFSLQRSFLKDDRLTVRLETTNPFGSKYQKYKNCTVQGDCIGTYYNWMRQSYVGLNVSWRFGKLDTSVKKTSKTIENSDVVGGMSKK